MILLDYIGNRACEELEKNFKDYLSRNELQKILLQCFIDTGIKTDKDIEKTILSINSDMIKPNMTKDEIKNNLKGLFNIIIDNNEEYYGSSENKKEYICSEYIKRSRQNILELYHILDALDSVREDIDNLIKASEKQQETSEQVNELYEELLKRRGHEVRFIDELDQSRVFWFCELEICTYYPDIEDTFEEIFYQLREEVYPFFKEDYIYDEMFCIIHIRFTEPLSQYRFRDFLRHLDGLLAREDIYVSRITTHD